MNSLGVMVRGQVGDPPYRIVMRDIDGGRNIHGAGWEPAPTRVGMKLSGGSGTRPYAGWDEIIGRVGDPPLRIWMEKIGVGTIIFYDAVVELYHAS